MFARLSDLAGGAALVAGDGVDISSRTVTVVRLNHVVEQTLFRLAGEPDRRGIAQNSGDDFTARLLHQAGMGPTVAHRYVRVDKALNEIPPVSSYSIGRSPSGEHADSIVKGLNHIDQRNPELADGDRAYCVRGLLTEALTTTPAAVSARARHVAIVLPLPRRVRPGQPRGRETCRRVGVKPHVTVAVTAEYLQTLQLHGLDNAQPPATAPAFERTGPASAPTAQMVACDSVITKILLDNKSVPLDVRREQRTVTPAIRKALIARDRGCAFPGCGCPAGYTGAHHIDFWRNGGTTSLTNMVLLCRRHHRYIHHRRWTVFIGHDGHPWFVPPDDASKTPLRSHARRTLTSEPIAA